MDVLTKIAANLKEKRKEKKYSRHELAERSQVAAITIRKIETTNYNPSIKTLDKLAQALEVDLITLIS